MTRIYFDFFIQAVQLAAQRIDQIPLPAAGQIGPPNAQLEQNISGEQIIAAQEADAAGRMARSVIDTEGEPEQLQDLAFGKIILCRFCTDRRRGIRPHQ
ncbi:hypothetical protein D3C73_1062330 [compost metagenome]